MKILNKTQVEYPFHQEAVFLGSEDAVPDFRAAALFGSDAVDHARKLNGSKGYLNGYGVGDYTIMYLTHRGFWAAASFYNVQQLRKEAGE